MAPMAQQLLRTLTLCGLLLLGGPGPLAVEQAPARADVEPSGADAGPAAAGGHENGAAGGAKAAQAAEATRGKDPAGAMATNPEASEETVRILDIEFPVPEPWTGRRVRVPRDTVANLALIPPELTLNGMEISLRREALVQLERMAAAAGAEGVRLLVDSGYRSAAYQRTIYERRLGAGERFEDIVRHTAPPGYSRHALGLAVDFHPSASGFQKSDAYRWLRLHAQDYGFHETYHRGNTLGVVWEPWHWEYRLERERPTQPAAPIEHKKRTTAPTDVPEPAATQDQGDSPAPPEAETAPQ